MTCRENHVEWERNEYLLTDEARRVDTDRT